jgi:hypothetical protein
MRKNFYKDTLTIDFLIISISVNAQIAPVKMLIGLSEGEVRTHYQSLFSKSSNPYYKIEESFSESGTLILSADFAMNEEKIFNCLAIISVFHRFKDIGEICVKQAIMFRNESAQTNISYMKDHFVQTATNKWESSNGITATLEKDNDNSYTIIYEMPKKK